MTLFESLHKAASGGQVEVEEKRFSFDGSEWKALPVVTLAEGLFWEVFPTFCERYAKRIDQDFHITEALESPEEYLYRVAGEKSQKSIFVLSIIRSVPAVEEVSSPEDVTDPEALAWIEEAIAYQADPFASIPNAMDVDQGEAVSQDTGERTKRIVEAVRTGDNRQRRKRGIPESNGKAYSPTVKITGDSPEHVHTPDCAHVEVSSTGNGSDVTPAIMDGTYTIVFSDAAYRTLRVRTQRQDADFAPGKQIVSYLSGSDNESSYTSFGILNPDGRIVCWKKFRGTPTETSMKAAVSVLLGDPKSAGLAYALASGNCYRCGRKLTVPTSIHQGLGPDCAAKAF